MFVINELCLQDLCARCSMCSAKTIKRQPGPSCASLLEFTSAIGAEFVRSGRMTVSARCGSMIARPVDHAEPRKSRARGGVPTTSNSHVRKRASVQTRAADGASTLTYVADSVIGSGLVLALARSGTKYKSRVEAGWLAIDESSDAEDDSSLRWTVASLVGCVPLVAWLAWILPVISVGDWDTERREGAIPQTEAFKFAAVYFLAYATHGFNVSDGFTWFITLLCAAHVQLEKTNATLVPSAASSLNPAKKRSSVEKDTTPRNFLSTAVKTSTVEKPDARDETSVQGAVQLGRALGQARVVARQLGESIAEGKLQAEIEQDALRTEEALKQEAELLSGELEEWDARFRLRTMKRSDLLELARARGLKKYSKLTKFELREALEKELFEE